MKNAQEETIHRLSIASETRDEETGAHIQRMSRYSSCSPGAPGLTDEPSSSSASPARSTTSARSASPTASCRSPAPTPPKSARSCRPTPRSAIASSPTTGYKVLEVAATIAYTHHERWDGAGYPRGLAGDDIPFGAQLFSVADVWDALTSPRPYRPRVYTRAEALALIEQESGRIHAPRVVKVFADLVEREVV